MKPTLLQHKCPFVVAEIDKAESRCHSVDEIDAHLRERIAERPRVQLIGVFDHHAHTRRIGGEIRPDIVAAVDVIFCFGFALPDRQMLAVRPRSIGVADLGVRLVLSFLEAPMKPANDAMEAWVRGLRIAHRESTAAAPLRPCRVCGSALARAPRPGGTMKPRAAGNRGRPPALRPVTAPPAFGTAPWPTPPPSPSSCPASISCRAC